MKHSSNKRAVAAQRAVFQLNPVAAGAAMLLVAMGAQAQTSTQPADASQTITVTGIRRGIENAISVKKNADGVVEAISSEDIGKLPDTTIAESLARLPGVTTQRDRNGNATNISVRGLGPDFNGYLLNGREQTSTGDSRAVDLSVYPAELIGGATIYKTSDASLMSAGLAGTIDNRLIDPLAFGSRVFSANAQKTKTGVGLPVTGSGHRFSLTYVDQFADRKLGVAIGYVRSEGTSNSLADGSWGGSGTATLVNGTTQANVSVPFGGGLGFESDRNKDERHGLAAIVSFKPNKDFTSQLDVYTAKIKTELKKMAMKAGNFTSLTNATVVGGVAQSGTFAMAPGGLIAYSENIFTDDKIDSLGWKNTLKFADGWSGSLDLNHNKATRIERDIEAYAGITTADTLSFTGAGGSGRPQLTLGNAAAYVNSSTIAIRDQSGWSGVSYPAGGPFAGQTVPQAGYSKGPTVTDKLDAVRLDFKKDLGDGGLFQDLQFGGNFSKRTKDRVTDEGVIGSVANGGYDRIAYPAGSYVANNVGGTGINLLTFDPQVGLWPGATIIRKYNDDILSKTWSIEEKVTTLYAKSGIEGKLGAVPIRGNMGLQIVNTDQSSLGYQAGVGSGVTLTNPAGNLRRAGTKYTDFLPSLNVSADVGGGGVLRFGASQQIARATLTDIRNSFAAAVDTNGANSTFGLFVGSAGNPQLKPFKAWALDISAEQYFAGGKGYVSAALFHKKLDTYITTATNRAFDYSAYASALGLVVPPAGPIGVFTTSVNGSGGDLTGIEVSASVPFNLLAPMLNGFGATASYSNTTSSVNLPNLIGQNPNQQVAVGGARIPLPGLSRDNAKFMLYYERGGFSAFVAENYRSTYVGSVANSAVGGYPTLRFIQGSSWVSAQIGYEILEGTLKGLAIRFEGNNMNKPVYREADDAAITNNVQKNETGASYAFKLSYKYY